MVGYFRLCPVDTKSVAIAHFRLRGIHWVCRVAHTVGVIAFYVGTAADDFGLSDRSDD